MHGTSLLWASVELAAVAIAVHTSFAPSSATHSAVATRTGSDVSREIRQAPMPWKEDERLKRGILRAYDRVTRPGTVVAILASLWRRCSLGIKPIVALGTDAARG